MLILALNYRKVLGGTLIGILAVLLPNLDHLSGSAGTPDHIAHAEAKRDAVNGAMLT